jgi:hypothetical protein
MSLMGIFLLLTPRKVKNVSIILFWQVAQWLAASGYEISPCFCIPDCRSSSRTHGNPASRTMWKKMKPPKAAPMILPQNSSNLRPKLQKAKK